jgi:GTP cyclohydrolase IA
MSKTKLNEAKIKKATALLIEGLGCSTSEAGFKGTPERVVRFYKEIFGEKRDPCVIFPEVYDEIVVLKNHRLFGLCPHHLLPVSFNVSIAYIPDGEVLGLSKLARVVESFNTRPILQEDLSRNIVNWFVNKEETDDFLSKGAACRIIGDHMCMQMRGVKSTGSVITTTFRGLFNEDNNLQRLFLEICNGHS